MPARGTVKAGRAFQGTAAFAERAVLYSGGSPP